MAIVPATEQDLEEVISWIRSEKECRMWAGPAVTYPLEQSTLAKEIVFTPDTSFACRSDEGLLAFGQVLNKDGGYCHLARIIANPQFRGKGFGRVICCELIAQASSMGKSGVTLNVYRDNTHAVDLYTSLGFEEKVDKSDDVNVFMVKG